MFCRRVLADEEEAASEVHAAFQGFDMTKVSNVQLVNAGDRIKASEEKSLRQTVRSLSLTYRDVLCLGIGGWQSVDALLQ